MADDDYSPDEAVRRFPLPGHRPSIDPAIKMDPDKLYAVMDLDDSDLDDPLGNASLALLPGNPELNFTYPKRNDDNWIFGPEEDTVILPVLLTAIGILSIVANCLVLASFLGFRRMRSGQNLMLVNVSVSDLLFVGFVIPVAILNHAHDTYPHPGSNVCRSVHYVIFVTVYVTMYTLVVTCLFRFFSEFFRPGGVGGGSGLAARRRSHHGARGGRPLTVCNAVVSCAVIWLAFLVSHIKLLVHGNDGPMFQEPFICYNAADSLMLDGARMKTLWVTFLSCAFLLPLIIVCLFSFAILHMPSSLSKEQHPVDPHLRKSANQQPSCYETAQNSANEMRNKRELTVVIMASTVTRSLCWLPLQVVLLLVTFAASPADRHDNELVYRKAEMLGVCFALVGTCVTPLVYGCASEEFRQTFGQMCGCSGCCRKTHRSRTPLAAIVVDPQERPAERKPFGMDLNDTILSIISDSSNHINYA